MALQVSVTCLRRRGMRIGNYRNANIERGIGELLIEEMNDPELKRSVRTARVLNAKKRPPDQLVPLRDVMVLWMKQDRMVLNGNERVADMNGPCEYAQTWLGAPFGVIKQLLNHKVTSDVTERYIQKRDIKEIRQYVDAVFTFINQGRL